MTGDVLHTKGDWITKKRWRSLLFLVFFLLSGCGSRVANYFSWWGQSSGRELQSRLNEGTRLFEEGNYSAAAAVFQDLQETGHQDVIRPALYGLACSRLILASDKEEWLEAIEILELWRRISPPNFEREDPRMLLSLLEMETFPGGSKGEANGWLDLKDHFISWVSDYKKRIDELEEQIVSLNSVIETYQSQANAMEEFNGKSMEEMEAANKALEETLKAKENAMQEMAEELSKLRGQIKTFETIDQEIQEKKQGISSP